MRSRGRPGETRKAIEALLGRGLSRTEIAARLGVSKPTITYHMKRLGFAADERFARHFDWSEVQRAIDGGATRRQCMSRFGFASCTWYDAIRKGRIEAPDARIPIDALLVVGRSSTSRTHLKDRLYEAGLKSEICERCRINEWRGEPIALQLHHINGVGGDNRLENLEILCPNCHAQTENWGGRNKRRAA